MEDAYSKAVTLKCSNVKKPYIPRGRNTCLQRIMSRPVDVNARFPDLLVDSEQEKWLWVCLLVGCVRV